MTDTVSPGQASRRATLGLLTAILLLLSWYLLADRLTPYSSQARVQAFVVPVAAEVAGQIKRVYVHDNQDVEAGAPCSRSIPSLMTSPWPRPDPTTRRC